MDALGEDGNVTRARLEPALHGPQFIGLQGEGGGLWQLGYADAGLRSFAEEASGMERERRVSVRRTNLQSVAAMTDSRGATLVRVFDRVPFTNSLSASWPRQAAEELAAKGYDGLEMELWLDCVGHADAHCGRWDFLLDLYICGRAAPECTNMSASVGRWITAYSREGRWVTNGSAVLPRLLQAGVGMEDRWLHLSGGMGQHYEVTLLFWLRRTGQSPRTALAPPLPLWSGGPFAGYNEVHRPIEFRTPPGTTTAMMSLLLTGHGWGRDIFNCAEFCNHSHFFSVNGAGLLSRAFPMAGTSEGCEAQVRLGTVPNQYGTWYFGRSGWCPGKQVEWWEADITSLLAPEGERNTISYWALLNGAEYNATPSDDPIALGFPANIDLASFLTFYGDAVQAPHESDTPPLFLDLPAAAPSAHLAAASLPQAIASLLLSSSVAAVLLALGGASLAMLSRRVRHWLQRERRCRGDLLGEAGVSFLPRSCPGST